MMVKSEVELVERIIKGNQEAFEDLHRKYQNQVASLACRFVGSEEDAEEIVQDVFTLVFRKIDNFEGKCALGSWIYRITVNCALMKVRSSKRRKLVDMIPLENEVDRVDHSINTEAMVANRKTLSTMRGIIDTLPDKFRAVFLMRDVNGLSGRETAEFLGLSESAVKSRLHRARELVKRKFEEQRGVENVADSPESYILEM